MQAHICGAIGRPEMRAQTAASVEQVETMRKYGLTRDMVRSVLNADLAFWWLGQADQKVPAEHPSRLAADFQEGRALGRGGQGEVFEAEVKMWDGQVEKVALKVCAGELGARARHVSHVTYAGCLDVSR